MGRLGLEWLGLGPRLGLGLAVLGLGIRIPLLSVLSLRIFVRPRLGTVRSLL